MKTQATTIPSFNQLITVELIFAALRVQYANHLRRFPVETPKITTAKLMHYARVCFRGFKKNLNNTDRYRDHVRLNKATLRLLASNGTEFMNAVPHLKTKAPLKSKVRSMPKTSKRATRKVEKKIGRITRIVTKRVRK